MKPRLVLPDGPLFARPILQYHSPHSPSYPTCPHDILESLSVPSALCMLYTPGACPLPLRTIGLIVMWLSGNLSRVGQVTGQPQDNRRRRYFVSTVGAVFAVFAYRRCCPF